MNDLTVNAGWLQQDVWHVSALLHHLNDNVLLDTFFCLKNVPNAREHRELHVQQVASVYVLISTDFLNLFFEQITVL